LVAAFLVVAFFATVFFADAAFFAVVLLRAVVAFFAVLVLRALGAFTAGTPAASDGSGKVGSDPVELAGSEPAPRSSAS
jgi:predicted lipid-binding transport protein (Tim44 family)